MQVLLLYPCSTVTARCVPLQYCYNTMCTPAVLLQHDVYPCSTDQCGGGQGGVRLAQGLGADPDEVGDVGGGLLGTGVGQQVLPCEII